MKEQKKLTIGMAIFYLIIFVSFGTIIVTEKAAPYLSDKIDKKLNEYIQQNYTSIIKDLKIGNTIYDKTIYQLKITSIENEDLYFYIKYSNKKITDTYKEDYLEGRTLLTKTSNNLEKKLEKKYQQKFKITILTTLNKLSFQVKKQVLNGNLESTPIYSLQTEIISPWNQETIVVNIENLYNTLTQDNIIPKSYNLIIIDQNKEHKNIKINNLSKEIITNNELLSTIISDIINGKNSNFLTENNITYEQIKE